MPSDRKWLEQAVQAANESPIRRQLQVCAKPPFGCGGDANHFRDELSRREYQLSALCQTCQDKVFADPEETE